MELKGNLSTFPLKDVLEFIREKGHAGHLILRCQFPEKTPQRALLGSVLEERLDIRKGILAGIGSLEEPKTLVRLLVRRGLISRHDEREMIWRLSRHPDLIRQLLPGLVELTDGELETCADLQLEESSMWCFSAREGDFIFEFAEPKEPFPGWKELDLSVFIEQGSARAGIMDEAWTVFPDPSARLTVTPLAPEAPSPETLCEEDWKTLSRINSRLPLRELLFASPLPAYRVAQSLLHLREKRLVSLAETTSFPAESKDPAPIQEPKGRVSGWKKIMGGGSREPAALPMDRIGRWCIALNRFLEAVPDIPSREESWKRIVVRFPGADLIPFREGHFDPNAFSALVRSWGGVREDWENVEKDCESALIACLVETFNRVSSGDGARKTESLLRSALSGVSGEDGFPDFERIQDMLSQPAA